MMMVEMCINPEGTYYNKAKKKNKQLWYDLIQHEFFQILLVFTCWHNQCQRKYCDDDGKNSIRQRLYSVDIQFSKMDNVSFFHSTKITYAKALKE